MKVKVLKSYYDPETEDRGIAGEVKNISEALYSKAKNLFEVKERVVKNVESNVDVKVVKPKRGKRRKK